MTFIIDHLEPGAYKLVGTTNGITTILFASTTGLIFERYWNETGELLFESNRLN